MSYFPSWCFIPLTILVGVQLAGDEITVTDRFIPLTILVGVQPIA